MSFNNEWNSYSLLKYLTEPFLDLVYLQHECQTRTTRVRHKRQECDKKATRTTRLRYEWDTSDTSVTQLTRLRHKCYTSSTWTTRVRHKCYTNDTSVTRVKNFDFDKDTSENIFSHPYISYMANEKLQGHEQFISKNYLLETPKCI